MSRIQFILLTLLMATASCSLFAQTAEMSDNFEDGNAVGWTPDSAANWRVTEGVYHVYRSVKASYTQAQNYMWLQSIWDASWVQDDFTIDATLGISPTAQMDNPEDPANLDMGGSWYRRATALAFCYQDGYNAYVVNFYAYWTPSAGILKYYRLISANGADTTSNNVQLWGFQGDGLIDPSIVTTLATGMIQIIQDPVPVEISRNGDVITVKRHGHIVMQGADTSWTAPHAGGQIVLCSRTRNTGPALDDISVKSGAAVTPTWTGPESRADFTFFINEGRGNVINDPDGHWAELELGSEWGYKSGEWLDDGVTAGNKSWASSMGALRIHRVKFGPQFTLEGWFKIPSTHALEADATTGLLFMQIPGEQQSEMPAYAGWGKDRGGVSVTYGADAVGLTANFCASDMEISGIEISYDEWVHVALARDGAAYTLYIDGEEAGFSEDTRYGEANLYQAVISVAQNMDYDAADQITGVNYLIVDQIRLTSSLLNPEDFLEGMDSEAPQITLSTTSVSIGDVLMGSSKSNAFSITNYGNADLVVSSISSDADDFKIDPASATVAGGQSQTVTVTFEPSKRGPQNATVMIISNDPDENTLSVSVSGNAIGPEITLDKSEIAFESVYLDSSANQALNISNTGEVSLIIDSISVSDSTTLSVRPTSRDIAPGTSHVFTITFIPRAKRSYSEAITVYSNDSPVTVIVTCKRVLSPPKIVLDSTSISFGNVLIDSTETRNFLISNAGGKDLWVGPIPSNDSSVFSISPALAMIRGGESLSYTVTFTPTAEQAYIDTLSIPSTDDTVSVVVTGTGVTVLSSNIHVNVAFLNFGETYVDSVSKQSFTIFNMGTSELTVGSISDSDSTIFLVNPTSAIIASDDSQTVLVTFCPQAERTYIDTLIIMNNDSTVSVVVTGTGVLVPPSKTCDFNGDGNINIADVISFLLLARDDPDDPRVDWNEDGSYAINDAIILLMDIMHGTCPDASAMLSSANGESYLHVGKIESLTESEIEHIEEMISQMNLTPEQEAAFRLALYGEAGAAKLPRLFSLAQNSPNPFNPSTSISYTVPEGSPVKVSLKVYNIRGTLVHTLINEVREPGAYTVFWDGTDEVGRQVSSGVYLYRMQAGDFVQTRKMVLLK